MIVDEVKVYLKAGNGGEGCCSSLWLSDRRIIGGGGDGGRGGDVILKVSQHCYDLYKFREKKKFAADNGTRGSGSNKKGKNGGSIIVNFPQGTIVKDLDGNCIVDMAGEVKEFLICRGGREGRGNYKKNCTFPPGEGEGKEVILDYRIPNDVAVIGFPNTGKTSLVNALTGKSFKVAHYPFTTTYCAWACCESTVKRFTPLEKVIPPLLRGDDYPASDRGFPAKDGIVLQQKVSPSANTVCPVRCLLSNGAKERSSLTGFTVMDTPPLKKDVTKMQTANFLKHLYRTKIIIFVSDSLSECLDDFSLLKQQISLFDKRLLAKKIFFYLLNKIDKIDRMENLKGVIFVSAYEGIGIEELKRKIVSKIK